MSTPVERSEATTKIVSILTGFPAEERMQILDAVGALIKGAPPSRPERPARPQPMVMK